MTLSPSQIKTVRHQFDCFCKKVLREECRDYERQLARKWEKETTFSDLPEGVLSQSGEIFQRYTLKKEIVSFWQILFTVKQVESLMQDSWQ